MKILEKKPPSDRINKNVYRPDMARFKGVYTKAQIDADNEEIDNLKTLWEGPSPEAFAAEFFTFAKMKELFGDDLDVSFTTLFDDIKRGVDLWIDFKEENVLGIDCTISPRSIGKKLSTVRDRICSKQPVQIKYFEGKTKDKLGRDVIERKSQECIKVVISLDHKLLSEEQKHENFLQNLILEQILLQLHTFYIFAEQHSNNNFKKKCRNLIISVEEKIRNVGIDGVHINDFLHSPSYLMMRTALEEVFGIDAAEEHLFLAEFLPEEAVVLPEEAVVLPEESYEWMTLLDFVRIHDLPRSTINRILQNFFTDDPRISVGQGVKQKNVIFLRSDLAQLILNIFQSKREEYDVPPADWQTVNQVEIELGFSKNSLRYQFEQIPLTDTSRVMQGLNTMGKPALFFSPEAISAAIEAKIKKVRIVPLPERVARVDFLTLSEAAAIVGISWSSMQIISEIISETHPEWIMQDSRYSTESLRKHLVISRQALPFIKEYSELLKRYNDIKQSDNYMSENELKSFLGVTSFDEVLQKIQGILDAEDVIVFSSLRQDRKFTFFSKKCADILKAKLENQEDVPAGYKTLHELAQDLGVDNIPPTNVFFQATIKELHASGIEDKDIFIDLYFRRGEQRNSTRLTRYYSPLFQKKYSEKFREQESFIEGWLKMSDFESRYNCSKKKILPLLKKIIDTYPEYKKSIVKGKMEYFYYSPECVEELDRVLL